MALISWPSGLAVLKMLIIALKLICLYVHASPAVLPFAHRYVADQLAYIVYSFQMQAPELAARQMEGDGSQKLEPAAMAHNLP